MLCQPVVWRDKWRFVTSRRIYYHCFIILSTKTNVLICFCSFDLCCPILQNNFLYCLVSLNSVLFNLVCFLLGFCRYYLLALCISVEMFYEISFKFEWRLAVMLYTGDVVSTRAVAEAMIAKFLLDRHFSLVKQFVIMSDAPNEELDPMLLSIKRIARSKLKTDRLWIPGPKHFISPHHQILLE